MPLHHDAVQRNPASKLHQTRRIRIRTYQTSQHAQLVLHQRGLVGRRIHRIDVHNVGCISFFHSIQNVAGITLDERHTRNDLTKSGVAAGSSPGESVAQHRRQHRRSLYNSDDTPQTGERKRVSTEPAGRIQNATLLAAKSHSTGERLFAAAQRSSSVACRATLKIHDDRLTAPLRGIVQLQPFSRCRQHQSRRRSVFVQLPKRHGQFCSEPLGSFGGSRIVSVCNNDDGYQRRARRLRLGRALFER